MDVEIKTETKELNSSKNGYVMKIKDAKKKVEQLENYLDLLLNQKELLFSKTQPQAVKTDVERAMGGKPEDKFLKYVLKLDKQQLNVHIALTQQDIEYWNKWIDKELKILGKYNDLEQLIIYYKEIYAKAKDRVVTWEFIAEEVNYSTRQCKRIYQNYKNRGGD